MEQEVWMKPPDDLQDLMKQLIQESDVTVEQVKMLRTQLQCLENGDMLLLFTVLKMLGVYRY